MGQFLPHSLAFLQGRLQLVFSPAQICSNLRQPGFRKTTLSPSLALSALEIELAEYTQDTVGDLARELAHAGNATWRRLLCDPVSGSAVDVSPRYEPPAPMARLCRVRDGGVSRHPTSGARVVELDHIVEYVAT